MIYFEIKAYNDKEKLPNKRKKTEQPVPSAPRAKHRADIVDCVIKKEVADASIKEREEYWKAFELRYDGRNNNKIRGTIICDN